MQKRLIQHLLFWGLFVGLYAFIRMLFAGPTDLAYAPAIRFLRFYFSELGMLPWKALPFYILFYYLIPRYFSQRKYLALSFWFILALFIAILGYRSMVSPLSNILYGETPDFNVFSPKRMLFTLTDILPALALASTVKLLKNRIEEERRFKHLEEEKLAAELNFLKAQTNPHFLFNTLNNLYGLARKNKPQTADSILKLSSIMRYILQECSSPRISLEKEVKLIEDFMALESLRYDDRLQISFKKNVDDWQTEIAPLILLPFVENAFKHGVSETRFASKIQISLGLINQQLQFQIVNSKEDDPAMGTTGLGLKNIQRQLELIYGSAHHLSLKNEPSQFVVNLDINLQND